MARFSSENQPAERRGRGKSERTRVLDALKRESKTEEGFYDELIRRAFNPEDNFAFREALQRLSPLKKATMPLVEFEFSQDLKPHEQASQVLKAISNGDIPPDIGNTLIGSISSMMKIQEISDIEERIKALESAGEEG